LMAEIEVCDVCGSTETRQFKCKVICLNCGTILRTCSDLVSTAGCGPKALRIDD
jgi:hypothetical protein